MKTKLKLGQPGFGNKNLHKNHNLRETKFKRIKQTKILTKLRIESKNWYKTQKSELNPDRTRVPELIQTIQNIKSGLKQESKQRIETKPRNENNRIKVEISPRFNPKIKTMKYTKISEN